MGKISTNRIPDLIRRLYAVRNKLAGIFPVFDPKWTLFSEAEVGQAWAAYLYGLRVWTARDSKSPNAATRRGEPVQVIVWADARGARDCPVDVARSAEKLVAILLSADGLPRVVYNGPAQPRVARGGDGSSLTWGRLGRLMKQVPSRERIPLVSPVPGKRSVWCRHSGRLSFPPPAPNLW